MSTQTTGYKHKLRHKLVYRLVWLLLPLILWKYRYRSDRLPRDFPGPYLVVCNHTTEVDMLLVAKAFPRHMYFVCGEHLLRSKHARLLQWGFDPIPMPRGGSSLAAVREIFRRIRSGYNVMIFPEGCRSFDGVTLPVDIAIGKLVKRLGCGLVTFRTSGGYFVAPRWAHAFRTGKISGQIVNRYTPEQLSQMDAGTVTGRINADLHEDAYERQRQEMEPYRCDAPAEGLENYLLRCPECGGYDTMATEGDTFRCVACGLEGRYDEFGFLRGEKLPFDNVRDWGLWMAERFDEDSEAFAPDQLRFTETEVTLYEILPDHSRNDLFTGTLRLFGDRWEIGDYVFNYADISASSLLYYGKSVLFTHTTGYFGLTGEHYHAWKSNRLYERSRQADAGARKRGGPLHDEPGKLPVQTAADQVGGAVLSGAGGIPGRL